MKLRVADLSDEVRLVEFSRSASEMDALLASGSHSSGQHFGADLRVSGEIYRSGDDVIFTGALGCKMRCECSRCLDEFYWDLERKFSYVIAKEGSVGQKDDVGVDHYAGEELDLMPLVCDEAMLGLRSVMLCSPECRGLCQRCGANLNRELCDCGASPA